MKELLLLLSMVFSFAFSTTLSGGVEITTHPELEQKQTSQQTFKQRIAEKLSIDFSKKSKERERKNNLNGWISLGSSIFSWISLIFLLFGNITILVVLLSSILAMIFGIRGLKRDKNRGMGIVGLILGGLLVVLTIITLILIGLTFGG